MAETPITPSPKRGRNWMRFVLIVSLALNLLVVGLLGGAFLRHEKPVGRHLDRMSMGLSIYIRALPEDSRTAFEAELRDGNSSRRALRKSMRERQRSLEAVLLAEPFSEEAVRQALTEHRSFAFEKTGRLQDAYVDAVAGLSDEARAAYFERVQDMFAKRRMKRKRKADE